MRFIFEIPGKLHEVVHELIVFNLSILLLQIIVKIIRQISKVKKLFKSEY